MADVIRQTYILTDIQTNRKTVVDSGLIVKLIWLPDFSNAHFVFRFQKQKKKADTHYLLLRPGKAFLVALHVLAALYLVLAALYLVLAALYLVLAALYLVLAAL